MAITIIFASVLIYATVQAKTYSKMFNGRWYFGECETDTENTGIIDLKLVGGRIKGTFSSELSTTLAPAIRIDDGTISGKYKRTKTTPPKVSVSWEGSRNDAGIAEISYEQNSQGDDELVWHTSYTKEIGDYTLSPDIRLTRTPMDCPVVSTTDPKTVLDYYYLLPEQYYRSANDADWRGNDIEETTTFGKRRSNIQTVDEKNMYLQYYPFLGEGDASMRVFKNPDGTHVVAVEVRACGPGCEQKLSLLEYKNGEWADVKQALLPEVSPEVLLERMQAKGQCEPNGDCEDVATFLYKLPRRGTIMSIYEQFSFTQNLVKFKWQNGKFILK